MNYTVYRYFDESGRLLYVGMTGDGKKRATGHARLSQWWPDVATATFTHYAVKSEALMAENKAILAEYPLYNRRLSFAGPMKPRDNGIWALQSSDQVA